MLRWTIRITLLVALAFVLLWSWDANLAPGSDGSVWIATLGAATVVWGAAEWAVICLSGSGVTRRRRLMLDGMSFRGTPIVAALFVAVVVGTALVSNATHPEPVSLSFLDMTSGGGTIFLQTQVGLAGALLGAVAFGTLVAPVTFVLAAVLFDNPNESEPRTWFGLVNRAELLGSAILLPTIPVALVSATVGAIDNQPGLIVLAVLMIVPFLLGALINTLGTKARTLAGVTTPFDEPLVKRLWR